MASEAITNKLLQVIHNFLAALDVLEKKLIPPIIFRQGIVPSEKTIGEALGAMVRS
jgi:ethanolamine ammonia-lyase small subunit